MCVLFTEAKLLPLTLIHFALERIWAWEATALAIRCPLGDSLEINEGGFSEKIVKSEFNVRWEQVINHISMAYQRLKTHNLYRPLLHGILYCWQLTITS